MTRGESPPGLDPTGVVARLLTELGKLPGVGPKTAERMAHHLLGAPKHEVLALAEALRAVKERIRFCRQCCHLTENELCSICLDPRRDPSLLCVVEQPRDLLAFERTALFRGLYHVLHGRIAPLENMGPEHLTLDRLVERVRQGTIQEVILATNPTLEGDGTALYVASLLSGHPVRITRLARGVATGSVLEFANNQMLADALQGRQTF
jgi:recombination protein RecR